LFLLVKEIILTLFRKENKYKENLQMTNLTKSQTELIGFCGELGNIAKDVDLSDMTAKLSKLSDEVKKKELLVPVVGGFSAGKSTFINSFLGKDILPEAITPETALATELRYSDRDYIEAVRKDNSIQSYSIDEAAKLKEDAKNYKLARLYLNNQGLKEIAPLILVDMPGFDSNNENHDKALDKYLGQCCHYVVLFSSEDGAINRSMISNLNSIKHYGGSFSFFLSKANLKPKDEVDDILDRNCETLEDDLNLSKVDLRPVGKRSGDEILGLRKTINPDGLYYQLYRDSIDASCQKLIEAINVRIKASGASTEENQERIKECGENIKAIEKKKAELMSEAKSQYSKETVDSIMDDINNTLNDLVDEVCDLAVSGKSDEAQSLLKNNIEQTIQESCKRNFTQLSERIVDDFAYAIPNFNHGNFDFDSSNLSTSSSDSGEAFKGALKTAGAGLLVKGGAIILAKSAIAPIALAVVGPILAAPLIPFVIVGGVIALFKSKARKAREEQERIEKEKQAVLERERKLEEHRENVRNKIENEVFPDIKKGLNKDISIECDKRVKEMIERISNEYDEKINNNRIEIEAAEKEKKIKEDEAKAQREKYEGDRVRVEQISKALFEKAS
jgi:hypothetical protein